MKHTIVNPIAAKTAGGAMILDGHFIVRGQDLQQNLIDQPAQLSGATIELEDGGNHQDINDIPDYDANVPQDEQIMTKTGLVKVRIVSIKAGKNAKSVNEIADFLTLSEMSAKVNKARAEARFASSPLGTIARTAVRRVNAPVEADATTNGNAPDEETEPDQKAPPAAKPAGKKK